MRYEHVIVGGGLAGGMIAQEYRAQGGDGSVLVIGSESHLPYHRPPLTKGFIRGETPEPETLMHPVEWWTEQSLDLRLDTQVTRIDPKDHLVELSDGERVEYGRLALATGATPRPLDDAVTIRTVDDSRAVRDLLARGSGRLGVIGGGFIGVEVAASATMKGWDVTMAVRQEVVWEHLFGPEVGGYFDRHLREHGVQIAERLPETAFDLVIAGIGVTPNIQLAKTAGLATNTGILVDERLCAGNDIWAVGDIAEYQSVIHHRRLRVEHWDVAQNHGAYVGKLWAGIESEPYRVVPYFFSDIGDWTWFEYVGPGTGRVDIHGSMDTDDFAAYYLDPHDHVTACLAVNRSNDIANAKQLITEPHQAPTTSGS